MKRILRPMTYAVAILALTTTLAMAQTQQPAPPTAPGPANSPGLSMPRNLDEQDRKEVDGPVKKIDPTTQTIQVGWFLGLLRTTLDVTDDTQIAVDGMKASFPDIREGDMVKASYEQRDGKNLAKSIEAESKGGTTARDQSQSKGMPESSGSSAPSNPPKQ